MLYFYVMADCSLEVSSKAIPEQGEIHAFEMCSKGLHSDT